MDTICTRRASVLGACRKGPPPSMLLTSALLPGMRRRAPPSSSYRGADFDQLSDPNPRREQGPVPCRAGVGARPWLALGIPPLRNGDPDLHALVIQVPGPSSPPSHAI